MFQARFCLAQSFLVIRCLFEAGSLLVRGWFAHCLCLWLFRGWLASKVASRLAHLFRCVFQANFCVASGFIVICCWFDAGSLLFLGRFPTGSWAVRGWLEAWLLARFWLLAGSRWLQLVYAFRRLAPPAVLFQMP